MQEADVVGVIKCKVVAVIDILAFLLAVGIGIRFQMFYLVSNLAKSFDKTKFLARNLKVKTQY